MKMKVKQLLEMQPALQILIGVDLPEKALYRISKAANTVQKILSVYHESRNKLLREYGTTKDNMSFEFKTVEDATKFKESEDILQNEEEEVAFPPMLLLAELGPSLKKPISIMSLLGILIMDDEGVAK